MRPRLEGLALVLAAVSVSGAHCGSVHRPEGGPATLKEALARLASRGEAVTGLRGFAKVEAYRDGERIRFGQVVLAQRPARLRVETLSPFDQPISYLAADGQTLSLYVLGQQRFLTGTPSAANVGRLFPLRLAPAHVVEVLLGGIPLAPGPAALDWDSKRGEWRISIASPEGPGAVRAWLRPGDLAPTRIVGPASTWSLDLDRYERIGPIEMAQRLRFRVEADDADVIFRWDDEPEVNPSIADEVWRLEPPRGVQVERMP